MQLSVIKKVLFLALFLFVGALFSYEILSAQDNLINLKQNNHKLALQALPVVQVDDTTLSYNEASGINHVRINISSSPITYPVVVTYTILGDVAVNGLDFTYTSTIRSLTFPTGTTQLYREIPINIIDDALYEPDTERVNVILQHVANGSLGSDDVAIITIVDNDPAPTNTPVSGIYSDAQEPNNTFNDATDIFPNDSPLCSLTLWPVGDLDYFRFNAKAGSSYEISTSSLTAGLDTFMRVYDPSLNLIGTNDDEDSLGSRASRLTIQATSNGTYYVEITNVDPSDPTFKEYCIEVDEIEEFTPTPSVTPAPGEDDCEFNSTFENACLIGVDEAVSLSFVPSLGSEQDTDILKLWVLPGVLYTCETFDLSAVTDTNIILYDQNTNAFSPWIGNADREPGDPSSKVSYLATYKGYIYIMIGPEHIPPHDEADQHTFSAQCTATLSTPTPTPYPTLPPGSGVGSATATPTATPFEFPTSVPTPTPIDLSFLTAVPPTPAVIQFEPLPTPTPATSGEQAVTINVTLYYDDNENFMPELTEGITDAAVALYDNVTGQLISFGSTNEAGMAQFSGISTTGALRVDVPFLSYSQIVLASNSEILIRVAPQPLPSGIP
ncbi:MAG: hypothetical protein GY943_21905 [Chloroflexi bacterium]|nr:hypothetical protein [Chloroflexota bacterium]